MLVVTYPPVTVFTVVPPYLSLIVQPAPTPAVLVPVLDAPETESTTALLVAAPGVMSTVVTVFSSVSPVVHQPLDPLAVTVWTSAKLTVCVWLPAAAVVEVVLRVRRLAVPAAWSAAVRFTADEP